MWSETQHKRKQFKPKPNLNQDDVKVMKTAPNKTQGQKHSKNLNLIKHNINQRETKNVYTERRRATKHMDMNMEAYQLKECPVKSSWEQTRGEGYIIGGWFTRYKAEQLRELERKLNRQNLSK